jgi:hypothetical protein
MASMNDLDISRKNITYILNGTWKSVVTEMHVITKSANLHVYSCFPILISSQSKLFMTETWLNSINKWIMMNTFYFDLKPSPQSIHGDYICSSTHPGHRFSRPLENLGKIRWTKGIEERNKDSKTGISLLPILFACVNIKFINISLSLL